MGPQLVVGPLEGIEDALLGVQIRGRRLGRAGFEGLVEAVVGAILLRAPGRDALMGDAELEPPDVEPVEPMDAGGSKRGPIVTADRLGQPAGPKELPEVGFDAGAADIGVPLATEQVVAEGAEGPVFCATAVDALCIGDAEAVQTQVQTWGGVKAVYR